MRTRPVARASGIVSCIRLRQRTNVDFPQPDGPMIAVMPPGVTDRSMSLRTWWAPNQAFSCLTRMLSAIRSPRRAVAAARGDPGRQADHEHQADQDQGAGPGLAVPVVVRRDRVCEDLERKGRDRLVESVVPEPVAEGGEEERRRRPGH